MSRTDAHRSITVLLLQEPHLFVELPGGSRVLKPGLDHPCGCDLCNGGPWHVLDNRAHRRTVRAGLRDWAWEVETTWLPRLQAGYRMGTRRTRRR